MLAHKIVQKFSTQHSALGIQSLCAVVLLQGILDKVQEPRAVHEPTRMVRG